MQIAQNENGDWPTLEEWPTVDADVTCRTPGCPVEGITFRVTMYRNADNVLRAHCGRCLTPNDDIIEVTHG
ncbi:hypothetical protein [Streptomyces naphthomycinicus]|uniref:hypothetical protein n=1 Tax=Streptomyces naphthomycinicus TaxID=2872625 RepID=UPI001CED7525|nr:hypothetical protein [Streptomyces sp. TML10]